MRSINTKSLNAEGFGLEGRQRLALSNLFAMALMFVVASVAFDLNLGFISIFGDVAEAALVGTFFVFVLHSLGKNDGSGFQAKLLSQDWAYLSWVALMGASMLWSVSAGTTFKTLAPLTVVWVTTLFLCRLPRADAVRAVLIVAAAAATLSLIAIPLLGEFAYQPASSTGAPELRGIFRHQLRLGAFMALALGLIVIARLNGDIARIRTKSSVLNVGLVLLLVTLLLLSRARGYAGEAAIALVLTILLSRRGFKKWVVLFIGSLSALVVANRFNAVWQDLQDSGFDTDLTGRAQVWQRTLNGVTDETRLLGHGFGTLKLSEFDYLFPSTYRAGHAHSSYIQAYFETGLVGLVALFALIVVQLVVAWRYSVRCNTYSYSLFLVLYTATGSITGLNYAGTLSALFCIMMLFLAIESRISPSATKAHERTGIGVPGPEQLAPGHNTSRRPRTALTVRLTR